MAGSRSTSVTVRFDRSTAMRLPEKSATRRASLLLFMYGDAVEALTGAGYRMNGGLLAQVLVSLPA
jgi:hypothetical protein